MSTLLENIKTCLVSMTETYCEKDITEFTTLEEIGYDEIDLLELCCMLEDELDIEMSDASVELGMNARDFEAIVLRIREGSRG